MLVGILAGLYGLVIGSFLNALVWRVHESDERRATSDEKNSPNSQLAARGSQLSAWRIHARDLGLGTGDQGKGHPKYLDPKPQSPSIFRGRSMCPHCHHELRWYDLVPVASWLALRGKCRDCGQPISVQYPLVELGTAAVFGLSAGVLAPAGWAAWVNLLVWLWVAATLIALSVYDLRWYLLPDRILLPALMPVALGVIVRAVSSHDVSVVWHHAAAAVAVAGLFYGLIVLSRGRWMGGGDVKLLFLMGLLLGPANLLVALFFAFDSAAVVGVGLIVAGKKSRKDYLPFGPFLAIGMGVAALWGPHLLAAYLGTTGL